MSNFNFNHVIMGGRISTDPEFGVTPSGVPVIRFNIAVNRRADANGETKADFFRVVAWRGTAEFISKFFRKSSPICLTGVLNTNEWTDNSGIKRYGVEIVADQAYFVDSKADAPAGVPTQATAPKQAAYNTYSAPAQQQQQNAPTFEQLGNEEELPF